MERALTLKPNQTLIGAHHKLSQLVGVDTKSRGRFGGANADPEIGYPMVRTVDVYGIKQEMHGRFLDIRGSRNIRIHGMAGINGPFDDGEAMFWIDDKSRDVLITNLGDEPQINGPSFGALSKLEGEELERELMWLRNTLGVLAEWEISVLGFAWHPENHLEHGILKGGSWFSGLNAAGEIFKESFSAENDP